MKKKYKNNYAPFPKGNIQRKLNYYNNILETKKNKKRFNSDKILFIFGNKIENNVSVQRRYMYDYLKNDSKFETIKPDEKGLYKTYDKIIVFYLNTICHFDFDISCYESNEKILILEDSVSIFYDLNIFRDMLYDNCFTKVVLFHCNLNVKKFLKFNKLEVVYFPYPINFIPKRFQEEKVYDILFFGCTNSIYPFRTRIKNLLKDSTLNSEYKIKIIDFKGYYNTEESIIGDDLYNLIKKSKFVVCTGSKFNLLLRKYIEVNYLNTKIIGNNPYSLVDEKSIVEINEEMSNSEILKIIKTSIDNYVPSDVNFLFDGLLNLENFKNMLLGHNNINFINKITK